MATAAPHSQDDSDDDDIELNPMRVLLPAEESEERETASARRDGDSNLEIEQHYLHSIKSTVKIRQLPSEGLSFKLWPAATTLVNLFDRHVIDPTTSPLLSTLTAAAAARADRCGGKLKILEIGSGTGLVGIAAAAVLGADVTVTDLPHVAPNLQFNAELNAGVVRCGGGAVDVAPLSWGEEDDVETVAGRGFDLVVASDVVYHDHLYDPLLKTLRWLLLLGGTEPAGDRKPAFVMAHLRRWKKDSTFFKRARKSFDVEAIYVDSPSEGRRIGVTVYRFTAKGLRNEKLASAKAVDV